MISLLTKTLKRNCISNFYFLPRYSISDAPLLTVVNHGQALIENVYPQTPIDCSPKFAIIKLGGTQYKLTVDDVIAAEKIKGIDIGETFDVKDVLLVGTRDKTWVGRPLVPGARVHLMVEEQAKDKKVTILKMRRRKSSKRTKGFRREVTVLRVLDILYGELKDYK